MTYKITIFIAVRGVKKDKKNMLRVAVRTIFHNFALKVRICDLSY